MMSVNAKNKKNMNDSFLVKILSNRQLFFYFSKLRCVDLIDRYVWGKSNLTHYM